MIPALYIEGWLPGTKDYQTVTISERLGPNATRAFLLNVPLGKAKQIVAAFQLLRDMQGRIEHLGGDK